MNLNKVTLIGRIGQTPEIRTFPNGSKLANASLATTEKWRDRQTGESKSHTEWHELVFNGSLVELVEKYVAKGSLLYVEGSLRTRKWQDKQTGLERYKTEISVSNLQLGPAPASAEPTQAPAAAPVQQQQRPAVRQQQRQQQQPPQPPQGEWEWDSNAAPF